MESEKLLISFLVLNDIKGRECSKVCNVLEEVKSHTFFEEIRYIVSHFKKFGRLPTLESFLTEFPSFVPEEGVNEPIEYYLDRFVEDSLLMSVKNSLFSDLQPYLSSSKASGRVALSKIENLVEMYHRADSSADRFDYSDVSERMPRYFDKVNKPVGRYVVPPFKSMQSHIHRFSEGNLITVWARPGTGKTWLSSLVSLDAALKGVRTTFVSPEMSVSELQDRIDALYIGFNWVNFGRGTFSASELLRYKQGLRMMSRDIGDNLSLLDKDVGAMSIEEVLSNCADSSSTFLVIDASHHISAKGNSEVEKTYNRVRRLKQEAKRLGLIVFQTVQEGRSRKGRSPEEAAQWGDVYLQESDFAMNLRGNPQDTYREIEILKARNGSFGLVPLSLKVEPRTVFEEASFKKPPISQEDLDKAKREFLSHIEKSGKEKERVE